MFETYLVVFNWKCSFQQGICHDAIPSEVHIEGSSVGYCDIEHVNVKEEVTDVTDSQDQQSNIAIEKVAEEQVTLGRGCNGAHWFSFVYFYM